jgi:hypothetical protein
MNLLSIFSRNAAKPQVFRIQSMPVPRKEWGEFRMRLNERYNGAHVRIRRITEPELPDSCAEVLVDDAVVREIHLPSEGTDSKLEIHLQNGRKIGQAHCRKMVVEQTAPDSRRLRTVDENGDWLIVEFYEL